MPAHDRAAFTSDDDVSLWPPRINSGFEIPAQITFEFQTSEDVTPPPQHQLNNMPKIAPY